MKKLADLIKLYGITAKSQLSQNFILDMNVCRKIIKSCGELRGATVIEVGSGPGGLTRALLEREEVAHVIAIEKDRRFLPILREMAEGDPRLTVVHGDALEIDEEQLLEQVGAHRSPWSEDARVHIVGNLPFNVATALLLRWVRQLAVQKGPFTFGRVPLTLLFQKEIAHRLFAKPRTKEYGRLSVMCQQGAHVYKRMDLNSKVFVPIPEVEAGLVTLVPLVDRLVATRVEQMEWVLRQLFGQRRKTVKNAMSTVVADREQIPGLLKTANIVSSKRPDDMSVKEWGRIADTLHDAGYKAKELNREIKDKT